MFIALFARNALLAATLSAAAFASAAELTLEIGNERSSVEIGARMDAAVRQFGRNAAFLTEAARARMARAGRYDASIPFSLPTTLRLSRQGTRLGQNPFGAMRGSAITLSFDASGPRSFPLAYRQLLEDTFAEAQSTMNAVFGAPSAGGIVHVRNYDADIGDRDAIAGGYYVPDNGVGEQEIRIPEYLNSEAAAINFVHCLLLAYMGPDAYAYDAFKEGLVRAATMRVARTAGALPAGLDPELIESVLSNTYDVGPFYDWFNQRGLGGESFIAPNLRSVPLPPGGSLGGIYLHRYLMSGSAWQKALVQYPAFAKTLNDELYANPAIAGNVTALIVKGQEVLNTLSGTGNGTLEGYSFADWFKRQFILETRTTLGLKLVCHPIPLPPVGGTNDFGVFDVSVSYFETLAGGNEVLLSGTSYPIFWSDTFDRVFPGAQEERMDIAGAYGSVAPNLPDLNAGAPYRCTADIPVQDRLARVYLPAGAVATGSNTTPNDFYGTVIGAPSTGSLKVRLTYGATVVDDIPVTFGAFGARIDTPAYLGSSACRVEVIHTLGQTQTTVVDRLVNKGPGSLALDLRPANGDAAFFFSPSIPKGLSTIGFPLDPYFSPVDEVLGLPSNAVLAARWNGSKNRYDIYPDSGPFVHGHGYFIRLDAPLPNHPVDGRIHAGTPTSVALRPGWNLIANPFDATVPTSDVSVVHVADVPFTFAESLGSLLGITFFEFAPGPNDAATGAPETGTMVPATQFQPGRAYFVRVLVAEGVTLLFQPQGPGLRALEIDPPPGNVRFLMRAKVDRSGHATEAQIGQSATATSGFDPREDSGLPPAWGGQQGRVANANLFRDVRSSAQGHIFTVAFDGLTPGQMYRFSTQFLAGSLPVYFMRPAGSGAWKACRGPVSGNFRATSSTYRYEIKVGAGA